MFMFSFYSFIFRYCGKGCSYLFYIHSFSDTVDDCVDVTCNEKGLCFDGFQAHTCLCDEGYTGDNCETGNAEGKCMIIVRQIRMEGKCEMLSKFML